MTKAMRIANRTVLALLFAACLAAPAFAERTEQAKRIGKRMMCLCGCNQVLTECNHVGCTVSDEMLKKLDQRVALGESEDLTIQSFVQEYGQRVLADPPSQGFNRLAVLMPIAALTLGGLMLYVVLMRMRRPRQFVMASTEGLHVPKLRDEIVERYRRQADEETGE